LQNYCDNQIKKYCAVTIFESILELDDVDLLVFIVGRLATLTPEGGGGAARYPQEGLNEGGSVHMSRLKRALDPWRIKEEGGGDS
jgi:hypothetical protein